MLCREAGKQILGRKDEGESPRPVVVLRSGGVIRAVAPDAPVVWFDGADAGASIEVYDSKQKRFHFLAVQKSEVRSRSIHWN